MNKKLFVTALALVFLMVNSYQLKSCTNLLVSKGASKDGSVMITYSADAGGFMEPLYFSPAKNWQPSDSISIYDWDSGIYLGKIKQVAHTYNVIGNINEFQVSIGETTFGGREELKGDKGVDYGTLIYIALQRAKTAREAISVMANLVEEYGYFSSGESFSIADKNEVWIMEMIGKGKGKKGANWVARKVPDGMIAAHANQARIREFPLNDPENCLYSKDVIDFAISQKIFDPKLGKAFAFADTYCPPTPGSLFLCEGRVWSIFRRAAPSMNLSSDYWRAVKGAEPYPLFIKPDKQLSVKDVQGLMRDHFEGTEFDMTKGLMAGPFGNPYRWKGLYFSAEGDTVTKYGWERPISTQQTAFSFVSQLRSNMPDAIGGVFWYGVDDTYSTCYMPLYCSMTEAPPSYTHGSINKFDWNSGFWIFNLVSNYAYGKYSYIIKDIQKVQSELEDGFLAIQPTVESAALQLYKTNPELAIKYLTNYSVSNAEMVVKRWQMLAEYIFTKYNDGYINEDCKSGRSPKGVGYGKEWIKRVLTDTPDYYKIDWQDKSKNNKKKNKK